MCSSSVVFVTITAGRIFTNCSVDVLQMKSLSYHHVLTGVVGSSARHQSKLQDHGQWK